ncbi:MAG TPA: FAD-linked oxidase C-terminal domain-containing protein [Fimbriimonadaceae bacterium]|nr:FAD-linked oxidase C-terminal domain-containing protein [Fimbriimonadaceae bacterium]
MDEVQIVRAMEAIVGGEHVLAGPSARRAYDCDAYTVDRSKPTCVVMPASTEEIAAIVKWCVTNETPFTARGAGTGLSGGALAALGGVIVSTKRMTKILEIDVENRRLLAQAGVANKRISDAVAEHGLHFAPDPSSQTVSTLGGNIAENSGGPHTLKYGVTVQHILGVKMVDPLGEVLTIEGGRPGFDFLGLIVGGEGTLGIVTEAWVKLTPLPKAVSTSLIAFPTIRDATETVAGIIASGTVPAALEMMDANILKALKLAFGLEHPDGTQAMLLVECDGPAAESVEAEMETVRAVCTRHQALEIKVAKDEAERAKMWMVRKKGIGAMGRLAPSIVTHDGVIPRSKLPEMLEFVYAVAERHGLGIANIFHAGDGNLHPCFYFDDRDPKQVEAVVEAGEEIIRRCIELGGSVTGEHGIGVEKIDLMKLMFSPADLELQSMAKRIFNDGNLCNPCKVLPNQKSCVEHKARWRGVAW